MTTSGVGPVPNEDVPVDQFSPETVASPPTPAKEGVPTFTTNKESAPSTQFSKEAVPGNFGSKEPMVGLRFDDGVVCDTVVDGCKTTWLNSLEIDGVWVVLNSLYRELVPGKTYAAEPVPVLVSSKEVVAGRNYTKENVVTFVSAGKE